MYTAAILAGGRATRFGGRDKSALVVDGRTILERQIAELSIVAEERLLVGGAVSHPDARTIPDLVPDCGPLGGLHAALSGARDGDRFTGHWGSAPAFVASVQRALTALQEGR